MNVKNDAADIAAAVDRWTHSFEEDTDGVEVYRPSATFAFPPSRRGRKVLQFSGGGDQPVAVAALRPGPDDRPHAAPPPAIDIIEATPAILRLVRR